MQETVSNNFNENKSELGNLSFRDLFYKYVRFLPVFVLSVAFALLGAFLYLRWTVPIYQVGGTILVKSDKGNTRGDKVEELFSGSKGQDLQSEMELLRSKPLMERVVKKLNLQFSYYAIGKVKTINIYRYGPFIVKARRLNDSTRSFSFKVKVINDNEFRINNNKTYRFDSPFENENGEFIFIKTSTGAGNNDYNVEWKPTEAMAMVYAGDIKVMPKTPGTGILNISMQTPNPQLGADIINKLMEEYGLYSIEQKKQSSDQILAFIEDRLIDYGHKYDSVQRIFLDYQIKNNLINAEEQTGKYFEVIGESDKAINEQTMQLSVAGMLDEYLADKKNEFTKVVVPSSFGIEDAILNELVGNYNKAQLERHHLLDANVPPANPLIKELNGQIEKLRVSIRESLKNIRTSANVVTNRLKERGNAGESQLRAMPEKVKELADIKRQVDAYLELYKLLIQKKEETAISRASTISNTNIIDKAFPVSIPISPKRKMIQVMAVLIGLAIPALFIFLGEVLNDKVSNRFDIERITAAPILGEIGHSYSDNVLVVNKTTRSMVAEQFRIIRSNLQYVLSKKEKSVLLITSSFSGEGKSYVTTNMGAVMALAGKKTIILEFDIRKPKLLSGLGIPKGPGITNYLIGKAELKDVIKPVPDQENLYVLGCGPIPPNPAELLLDKKVEEMFVWLKENFDIILVDTAPVGMVSDAMTLSKFADSTLYLVRQGHTFKKQVGLIDEFYQQQKLPKVSIIINDVKVKPGYGYYGYGRYGYGYGYGYGSYYEEETAPRNFIERVIAWFDIRRFFRKSKKK